MLSLENKLNFVNEKVGSNFDKKKKEKRKISTGVQPTDHAFHS